MSLVNIYFYIEEMNWKLILIFSFYVDLYMYIKMSILFCYIESLQLMCSENFVYVNIVAEICYLRY